MNIRKLKNHLATAAAAALVTMLAMPPAYAAPLAITDTPLFLMSGVKPNLIMAIDDSGSMDGEMLLRGNDGAAWWRHGASGTCNTTDYNNSFTGCIADATGTTDIPGAGRLNFNNTGEANCRPGRSSSICSRTALATAPRTGAGYRIPLPILPTITSPSRHCRYSHGRAARRATERISTRARRTYRGRTAAPLSSMTPIFLRRNTIRCSTAPTTLDLTRDSRAYGV